MRDSRQVEQFHRDGFLIARSAIPPSSLEKLRTALFTMARKSMSGEPGDDTLAGLLEALERLDHRLVYRLQKAMGTSCWALQVVTGLDLGRLHAALYGIPEEQVHAHLFSTPIQFPHDERFDFAWHQESGSYMHRSPILTCWFPILGPVNEERGSVEIIPGSHARGKREARHEVKESGLNDWIVDPDAEELERRFVVALEPGDVLLFDGNLIHRSVANRSGSIRITGIARTVDGCAEDEVMIMAEPVNYHRAVRGGGSPAHAGDR